MTCPYLEYRKSGDGREFDHSRPFCNVTGVFVSPMKSDICNDRSDFDHAVHCDIYRNHDADDG
jgi:hypothetical protein